MADRLSRPRSKPNRSRTPISTGDPWVGSVTDTLQDAMERIEALEAQQVSLENTQTSLADALAALSAALAALIASLNDPLSP